MKQAQVFTFIIALALASCQTSESPSPVHEDQSSEQTQVSTSKIQSELDSLNGLIRENPNNLDVLESRARIYLRQQNLKYAQADVSAILAMDSSRIVALELFGDLGFATNQTRQSRDAWTKCMALDPSYVPCRLKMAQLYHVVTEFEKSAVLVDRVLEIDPKNPEAHFLKGLLMRDALGDTLMAISWFQKAIDIAPDYTEALDMCGVLYSAINSPLAIGYFNRLIELNPLNRMSLYNRGMYYLGKEDWNGALEDFTKCTQLDPTDIESMFNLGFIHLQLELPGDARYYFNQALEIQPINHRALYGRGYCFELLGDMPKAESDYRQALSYNPSHAGSRAGILRVQRAK